MNAVVIEHVKVSDLPEAWRERLDKPADAHVTVRIEDELARHETQVAEKGLAEPVDDPAFGIWRDRDDMTDVAAYLRKIRSPRYNRNGARNED